MVDETLEVTIGQDGKVTMTVVGVAGPGCVEQTEEFVQLLGGEVESQELTAEAYVEVAQQEPNQQWH